jgi:uroporphyrinogen-III decarboxylase
MRGVFVRSWRLVGMQNYMFQLIDNPGFLHKVAATVVQFNLRQLEQCAEAGVDVLIIEDDIADRTDVSSRRLTTGVRIPLQQADSGGAHGRGLKVVRHSDGNLWPILDMLIEAATTGSIRSNRRREGI